MSYENTGEGDCLFESFKQYLHLDHSVLSMRTAMVHNLAQAPHDSRVSQLNEHLMRELDARNEHYMGWGFRGADGLDEQAARNTVISQNFVGVSERYAEDMQFNSAYAGNAEAVALSNMYGCNLTIWRYKERNSTATHLMTYLQQPPSEKTVHLLSIDNLHYESTNLPSNIYPVIDAPSSRHALSTRAKPAKTDEDSQAINDSDPALQELSRPGIEEYCGLVLNDKAYFQAILDEIKIYEVRIVSRQDIPPRIVFHPNRQIRDGGYTQNIEAKIFCYQHDKELRTAQDLLQATNNGAQLGLTETQTVKFVEEAKKKNQNVVFYLYKLEEPKISQIEWIDSPTCNQNLFSKPVFRVSTTGENVTLFRWPVTEPQPPADPPVLNPSHIFPFEPLNLPLHHDHGHRQ